MIDQENTNTDQLTQSKKNELEERFVTEEPLIVNFSEINSKNGRNATDNYSIHPLNLNAQKSGRGIIVYAHNSFEKSVVQIRINKEFEECCLLEVRLRNGDSVPFQLHKH